MAEQTPETTGERLGQVLCPSGVLLALDGGLIWMWSHDRAPMLPEWSEMAPIANTAVDVGIVGDDSEAAGIAFDRSNHPLYLFDRSQKVLAQLEQDFTRLVRDSGLKAWLEPLPERVPHHRRMQLALERGKGAGIVDYHGMWAGAFSVPKDRPLPIMGERMPAEGDDHDRWRRVWVEIGEGIPTSRRRIGHVLVDEARIMLADADAIDLWNDHDPSDGRADLVFWGADAESVARDIGALTLPLAGEDGNWGWTNLPLDDALQFGERLERAKSNGLRFTFDFRPHTDLWKVMADIRASPTESGGVGLGDAETCMFMTSWGDGAFPIDVEFDAEMQPVRISIEVGDEVIVGRQRAMEKLWFGEFSKAAMVSARVADGAEAVRFAYREAPDHDGDSGWRVFSGREDQVYSDDPRNFRFLPLRELIERDSSLESLFDHPFPCAFERVDPGDEFSASPDFDFGQGLSY